MSYIVTSVLDLTLGLLCSGVCSRLSYKLKDGDITDEKCRQLFVGELDNIKTKLDGLARKDLLSSVSFLKEGLTFLNLSQDESTDGKTSSPQEQKEDISQAEESAMAWPAGKLGEPAAVSGSVHEACSLVRLSKEIRKPDIAFRKHFVSAMRSFQESNKEATKAFNNEGLSPVDRILATELRVVSRILECMVEKPDAAVAISKLYLEELHRLPAVREMFSVQLRGGMKSRFNKTKRLKNVKAVIMTNIVVLHFTKTFTNIAVDLPNWPKIEFGRGTYNPVIENIEVLTKIEESGAQPPNKFTSILDELFTWISAGNIGKGEFV